MKDNTSQMEIKKYWQLILRRRYLFIAVSLFCLSVVVWGSFFMPKIYEAKSTVFIEKNIIKNLVQGIAVTPSLEERLRILKYAMLSRNMLLKVVNALGLNIKAKNKEEIESFIKNFQKDTDISVKENDLFTVSYKGKDPVLVRDYVNTLINEYLNENKNSQRQELFGATKFLSEQIDFYKKKIEESEKILTDFRSKKGIYLAIDEKEVVTSIKANKDELENVNAKVQELEAKKAKIKQQLSGESPLTVAILDKEGGDNSLNARLRSLEQKIPMLLTKYTENYPEVIRIRAEIETIKKQIENKKNVQNPEAGQESDFVSGTSMMNPLYQQLKEELFHTESEIDSLRTRLRTLGNRIKKSEVEMQNIPEEKKELASLERDRDSYRKIYDELLARLGQSEVSEQMEIQDKDTTFRIVDPAILPVRPVSPNRVKLILLGILAGAATGIGAVLLADYVDNSIRDIDTLKSQIGMPVLAVIPTIVTEKDIERKQMLDKRIYAISIAYLSIIGIIFIRELLVNLLH